MRTFPSHCSNRMFAVRRQQNRLYAAMIFAAGCTLLSGSALAQVPLSTVTTATSTPQVRLIEWDLPTQLDAAPGAMVVDTQGDDRNRIWFVTRTGAPPHAYRMDFPSSLMKGNARWTSWELSQGAVITGGIADRRVRPSKDRRFVFVRTIAVNQDAPGVVTTLERIDTRNCSGSAPQTCERVVWTTTLNETFVELNVSDVAIDDSNNVFTTHSPHNDPALSYVERLTPGFPSAAAATVTRWTVDGGAGLCSGSTSDPCVAGIAVYPSNRSLVYFSAESAGGSGAIVELNTTTNKIRLWSLAALSTASCTTPPCAPIEGPRQLHIDRSGKVWTVTRSGHLVSLRPNNNQMTAHLMPSADGADPFGVAPDDDVVGYTNAGTNKVGLLIPRAKAFVITPASPPAVPRVDTTATPSVEDAVVASAPVSPQGKTVAGQITRNPDGTYVEALINAGNDSMTPLGITPARSKAEGTFFYTVGENLQGANRVGFVRLPRAKEKLKQPRDDDDRDDGWNGEDRWHDWHDHANANDDDDDGIANGQDSPSGQETVSGGDVTPLASGQTVDYTMTASPTTLALIAVAEADDALAQIGIDIYNAQGLLVARSAPSLGIAVAQVALPPAGTYTWRVRNYGGPVNYTPTSIVREPSLPLVLVP
jgi:hypothetical protein